MLVAGFQGVSTSRDVTTLGRGGSDTTAVALAAAIGAEVCEIYTDVAGVFTADPRIVPDARKLPHVSFEEMLEMAASGAKVLQLRSVEYARTHGVRIHCRSSFEDGPGTVVIGEDETMEHPLITAVTHSTEEARITLLGVPDRPGAAAAIFRALADANCNVDTIIQNEPRERGPRRRGVVHDRRPRTCAPPSAALEPVVRRARASPQIDTDPEIGKVSIVGAGMRSHPGVAAKVFETLAERGDQHRDDLDLADQDLVRDPLRGGARRRCSALHDAFELEPAPRSSASVRSGRRRDERGSGSRSSAPPAPSARRCSSAARARASRPTRSSRSRPSARPGRELDGAHRPRR